MPQIRHALSGALYDVGPDGRISVEKDGKVGYFSPDGRYLEGEITSADPQLCGWIGGVQRISRHEEAARKARAAAGGSQ
jgi:hypothetical protein